MPFKNWRTNSYPVRWVRSSQDLKTGVLESAASWNENETVTAFSFRVARDLFHKLYRCYSFDAVKFLVGLHYDTKGPTQKAHFPIRGFCDHGVRPQNWTSNTQLAHHPRTRQTCCCWKAEVLFSVTESHRQSLRSGVSHKS